MSKHTKKMSNSDKFFIGAIIFIVGGGFSLVGLFIFLCFKILWNFAFPS